MLVLAADLLATRAAKLLEQLAHAGWEPAVELQRALDCYNEVRGINVLKDATEVQDDPQCVQINEPAPATQRSESHRQ